ncbi:MAG TPA: 23S rRNA (pseudouridine(1915)-N(3))-methyltransferase RlmH [Methanocorpusculum sp.]|nr:23S rRNA (pseudouridine(1915)-N(3))-methyltransferase RlmH [Methanocorpusculum sp.]
MQIQILCVGKIKDAWIAEGIAEFDKRLRPYAKVFVTELAEVRIPERAGDADEAAVKKKEGEAILAARKSGFLFAVLDPRGTPVSSEEFAKCIGDAQIAGRAGIAFVIGGPLGLSEEVISAADKRISFSRMTFTHTMCRLILFEQVYRGYRILSGEPYHK